MLFPTVEYALFFLAALWLAWSTVRLHRLHKSLLLVLSYGFYAFWDWRFVPLLLTISLFGWAAARGIASGKARHAWLAGGVVCCLGVLGYYKYLAFFSVTLVDLAATMGFTLPLDLESGSLPLGISFMTFHAISLMVDMWRGKLARAPSVPDALLYVAFFPQLIAGPILRASTFMPQLERAPDPRRVELSRALTLILGGLFKKVVLANTLGTLLVDPIFESPTTHSAGEVLLAIYGYAVQIYCDFSGYTDIAIGCALLLGYRFPPNFAAPYAACNPQDFWRRWHISLSTWLRDYLFLPLGGSRKGALRTLANLMITMLLGGLWHGAAWTFVLWGGWHGALLCMHRLWQGYWATRPDGGWRHSSGWRFIARLLLFHGVCIGWVLFRCPDLARAQEVFGTLLQGAWTFDVAPGLMLCIALGLGMQYVPRRLALGARLAAARLRPVTLGVLFALGLIAIELLGPSTPAPFIYFQF